MVVFGQKWLYSDKVFVLGKSSCSRANWLCLGKSGCIRAKVDVSRQKLLYLGTVVVFGQ